MRVIIKKCHGGEWYRKAINKDFELIKKVGDTYYKVKVEPEFAYLLKGREEAYIYISDAEII